MYIRNFSALYIIKEDKVLLMYKEKSRAFKNPIWVTVGGHFESEDLGDPLACIRREMNEEVGLTCDDLKDFKLHYITLRMTKDELRNQYIYFSKLKDKAEIPETCDEGTLEWVKISELHKKNMSVTNTAVLNHFFSDEIDKENIYGAVASADESKLNVVFTELCEYSTNY